MFLIVFEGSPTMFRSELEKYVEVNAWASRQ